jgi:hypothetical protein
LTAAKDQRPDARRRRDCIFDRLPGGDCADLADDVLHVLSLSTIEFSRGEKIFRLR